MNDNLKHLLNLLNQEADLIDKNFPNSSFRYKSTQRLILENGIPFEKRIKPSFKGEPKQCYQNCFKALLRFPSLHYCEGFIGYRDLPMSFAHAWLVNDKGQIIEPTLLKKEDANCAYFGVVFDTEFVMDMAEKLRVYGILENDFMNKHQLKKEGFPKHALSIQFHPNA